MQFLIKKICGLYIMNCSCFSRSSKYTPAMNWTRSTGCACGCTHVCVFFVCTSKVVCDNKEREGPARGGGERQE